MRNYVAGWIVKEFLCIIPRCEGDVAKIKLISWLGSSPHNMSLKSLTPGTSFTRVLAINCAEPFPPPGLVVFYQSFLEAGLS